MSDFQVDKKSKYSRYGLHSFEDEIQSIILYFHISACVNMTDLKTH